jgi:hypothetical protein
VWWASVSFFHLCFFPAGGCLAFLRAIMMPRSVPCVSPMMMPYMYWIIMLCLCYMLVVCFCEVCSVCACGE